MSRTYELYLPGVRCVRCVQNIEKQLSNCKQLNIKINNLCAITKKASITIENDELNDDSVKLVLNKILPSYKVEYLSVELSPKPTEQSIPRKIVNSIFNVINNRWLKGIIGILAGAAILGLMLSGVMLPLGAMIGITVASSLLALYLGWDSYYQALSKLFIAKSLTMDALFAISTLATISVSIAAFFVPGLPMLLDAALLIFGFNHIGKAMQEAVSKKVVKGLTFHERVNRSVRLANSTYTKALEKLVLGDEIVVLKGEVIPVDGFCIDEEASIYDTIITGKNLPRRIKKDEPVLAGMKVAADIEAIRIKVTASESASYLTRLDENIKKNYQQKAPIETFTGKILQYFIPTIILLALVAGIITSIFFPPAVAIQCSVYILVAACPCILGLITPLAVKIGLVKAAENGAVFKNGKSLQSAAQIDTIVFDLNGTLTRGEPIVRKYLISENLSEPELLAYVAALEEQASHPIAKAIRTAIKVPANVKLSEVNKVRYGISGKITDNHSSLKDKILTIGNQQMMQDKNIDIRKFSYLHHIRDVQHVIYLALDNKAIGYILLQDPLRQDAKRTITELTKMGKQVRICTGADQSTANHYAKQLGIPINNIMAECIGYSDDPQVAAKNNYIQQLQKKGYKVAMVGDAGNDAVAFSKSDLGIAVRSSASDEVTIANADITINYSSMLSVVTAFTVAKQTINNIKQNLGISLSYNMLSLMVVGIAITTAAFALHPAIGVALMIVQTSFVLLNAYRFKNQKLTHLEPVAIIAGEDNLPLVKTIKKQNVNTAIFQIKHSSGIFHKKQYHPLSISHVQNKQTDAAKTTAVSHERVRSIACARRKHGH